MAQKALDFHTFEYEESYFCTKEFYQWWSEYYFTNSTNELNLLAQLIAIFPSLQKRTKKSRGTHMQEIQAFHIYF